MWPAGYGGPSAGSAVRAPLARPEEVEIHEGEGPFTTRRP